MQLAKGTLFERTRTHTNRLRTRVASYNNLSARKQLCEQYVKPSAKEFPSHR